MTRAEQLQSLLDQVESAEGASRELDARIHHALFPDQTVMFSAGSLRPKEHASFGDLRDFPIDGWDDYDAVARLFDADQYTSSVDAALALFERVLPGWFDVTGKLRNGAFIATVSEPVDPGDCHDAETAQSSEAPTRALALISAILKALIAQEKNDGFK